MALLGSLNSGVSALDVFTKKIDVHGNNIANVSTTGFKASNLILTTGFGNVLNRSTPSASGSSAGSNSTANQIGSGVRLSSIAANFAQGPLESTGVSTDFAIVGNGYFRVLDTVNGKAYATRAGNFRVDDRGYLVTAKGFRVQGQQSDLETTIPKYGVSYDSTTGKLSYTKVDVTQTSTDPTIEDIKTQFAYSSSSIQQGGTGGTLSLSQSTLDAIADGTITSADVLTMAPAMESFAVDQSGNVTFLFSDGTAFSPYKFLLMNFKDRQALIDEGEGLYSGFEAAGASDFGPSHSEPGLHGLGYIRSGAQEMSNVNLSSEFSNLITTQRSFQAAARIISTSDEILSEIVNLKR